MSPLPVCRATNYGTLSAVKATLFSHRNLLFPCRMHRDRLIFSKQTGTPWATAAGGLSGGPTGDGRGSLGGPRPWVVGGSSALRRRAAGRQVLSAASGAQAQPGLRVGRHRSVLQGYTGLGADVGPLTSGRPGLVRVWPGLQCPQPLRGALSHVSGGGVGGASEEFRAELGLRIGHRTGKQRCGAGRHRQREQGQRLPAVGAALWHDPGCVSRTTGMPCRFREVGRGP